jgi:hypothetical protein
MSLKKQNSHKQSGFTMVVIAALFVAFAVIAAAVVERNTTLQLINRRNEAIAQLNRLSYAIIEYAVFNQSSGSLLYPCPALPNLTLANVNFGKDAHIDNGYLTNCSSTTGDRAGVAPEPPVVTAEGLEVLGAIGASSIRGMVPVQALSQYAIGINDAFDPWNNRIMYVVNRNVTKGATFTQDTALTITNPRPAFATTPSPDFILISYGRDGVGSYKRNSSLITIPCGGAATSTVYRLENCDSDTNFINTASYVADNANGTASPPTALNTFYFDDLITSYRQ